MQNLRKRIPNVIFYGISLCSSKYQELHRVKSFDLCASDRLYYSMLRELKSSCYIKSIDSAKSLAFKRLGSITRYAHKSPYIKYILKSPYKVVLTCAREILHCANGYRFLRHKNLLIIAGGGQIDEEWGGAYGHPYALLKWSVLSRIAGVPCAFASVGACKIRTRSARLFLSIALRLACYRSYRDSNSRTIASSLQRRNYCDFVVPDLAFSLKYSPIEQSGISNVCVLNGPVIAISLIAYAKPGRWPSENQGLYDRYLIQMASVVTQLLKCQKRLIFVCSSLVDDESVISDLLELLSTETRSLILKQLCVQKVVTWQEYITSMRYVELLIASRLHSAILAAICNIPIIAISFDSKVDWMMTDLEMSEYVMPIRNFIAGDVLKAVTRVQECRGHCVGRIKSYQSKILPICERQYDDLVDLTLASGRV
jgi:polysaccharide pyruvyl transferase WcaK-like protein